MKQVLDMHYSKLLGIKPSDKKDYMIQLDFRDDLSNHLGVFHASVIFSFAELSSGCFMSSHFSDERERTFPMLRKTDGKFFTPTIGRLYAKSHLQNDTTSNVLFRLNMSDKVALTILTDVFNHEDKLIFRGRFDWFVKRRDAVSANSVLKQIQPKEI